MQHEYVVFEYSHGRESTKTVRATSALDAILSDNNNYKLEDFESLTSIAQNAVDEKIRDNIHGQMGKKGLVGIAAWRLGVEYDSLKLENYEKNSDFSLKLHKGAIW